MQNPPAAHALLATNIKSMAANAYLSAETACERMMKNAMMKTTKMMMGALRHAG